MKENIQKISTVKEVAEIITDLTLNEKINRYRSSFMFRGLSNAKFALSTSLQRNCGDIWTDQEGPILRNFYKYAVQENPYLDKSPWTQMIIGQHHGLPTRLLDWSNSPLVALHFATIENDLDKMEKHDSLLWKINIEELNALIPQNYKDKLVQERAYVFTIDMLDTLAPEIKDYDETMQGKAMVTIEPPSIDSRITNQYSYFTVVPKGMDDIEKFLWDNTESTVKYVIDKNIRWYIREMLDRNNINERITYPGLEGVSLWLKRHYYNNMKNNVRQ